MVPGKLVAAAWLAASIAACTTPKGAPAPTPPPRLEPKPSTNAEPSATPLDWEAFDSTSLRNPNDGSLEGGVPLPLSSPGLRFNPSRDPSARFGTVEVVRALVQAAERVDRELGGLPLTVNDLSLERGGPIPHHRSHQSGRDVDVLFYLLDQSGEPIESVGAFFDPKGEGVDFRDLADPADDVPLRLDLPRIWLFLQALIEDGAAQLQNIYVAEHIRTLLLAYARASDAPRPVVERFAALTCQPRYPHDDHFHFRFFCTPEDIGAGCRDSSPIYPWQRALLRAAGVEPLPLAPKREGSSAKVVSHEEARKAAGPMDPEVERWLDRRQAWIVKPHPGRPYCP